MSHRTCFCNWIWLLYKLGWPRSDFILVRRFRDHLEILWLQILQQCFWACSAFADVRILGIRIDFVEKVEKTPFAVKCLYSSLYESPKNDVAETRCEHSLWHGQTIDILTIAKFDLHQEIWSVYNPTYKVKIFRWGPQNLRFSVQFLFFWLGIFVRLS